MSDAFLQTFFKNASYCIVILERVIKVSYKEIFIPFPHRWPLHFIPHQPPIISEGKPGLWRESGSHSHHSLQKLKSV